MKPPYTFAGSWDSFRREVMHPDSSPGQIYEMRLAFYAGAVAMLFAAGRAAETPDGLSAFMARLEADAEEYYAEIKHKAAERN